MEAARAGPDPPHRGAIQSRVSWSFWAAWRLSRYLRFLACDQGRNEQPALESVMHHVGLTV